MRIRSCFLPLLALVIGVLVGWEVSSSGAASIPRPAATGPDGLFKDFAPTVIQTLQTKGMTGDCPMCKKNEWVVHEVPVSLPVYEATGSVKFPGTSMPVAVMICRNCGFMSMHSLGALKLINAADRKPDPETKP